MQNMSLSVLQHVALPFQPQPGLQTEHQSSQIPASAQGVSGPSLSCVWNPRVFADDARGWQCPFLLCLHTPVFLPGESQGWGSLVGCRLWGRTESDTTEAT